jgi:DNA-binding MurR/RpiR family transcriptional regulator
MGSGGSRPRRSSPWRARSPPRSPRGGRSSPAGTGEAPQKRGYRAFALTTNSSVVTALANDFGYDEVFSRQLEAMGGAGDVLLALSTSGSSPNVVAAVRAARGLGMSALAFSGAEGGALAEESQLAVVVAHDDFARIQELHMALGHILCGLVEEILTCGGPESPGGPPE